MRYINTHRHPEERSDVRTQANKINPLIKIMILQPLVLFACFVWTITTSALAPAEKIDAYLINENFNGAVLIVQNGITILKKGYGYACFEFDIKNTPQTKFLIASNTKSFTAVAIMQLQEQNLLSVHDTLDSYIPNFPQGKNITIYHLLTHS